VFMAEPPEIEARFRKRSSRASASPKTWADAWLLAFAEAAGATLITFDRALTSHGARCLLR